MSKGNRTRRKEAGLLPAATLCSARKKDGTPCRRSPINGASVCRAHGGAAPQVVAAARRRLMEGSNQMAVLLMRIAEDDATPPAVRLGAIRDVLDRAGVTSKTEIEVTVQPWQQIIEGIVSEVDDNQIRPQGAFLDDTLQVGRPKVIAGGVFDEDEIRQAERQVPERPQPAPPTAEVKIPSRRKKQNRLGR